MRRTQSQQDREEERTLEMLRRPGLGREAIALLMVRLVELRHPAKKVELVANKVIKITGSDGRSVSIHLQNLWIECEKSPEDTAEIVARYVRVLAPDEDVEQQTAGTTERVVALVRDQVYRDLVAEEEADLITRHLVGDLWVVYALDLPESTNVLQKKTALSLNLDAASLLRLGRENVEQLLGQIEFTSYGECFTLACEMICYATSTLLLDYVWEQAKVLVSGDVVVAAPARDTVLFTGSQNAQGLCELREEAHYVVTNGHHIVSETLLRRVGGEWKVFS